MELKSLEYLLFAVIIIVLYFAVSRIKRAQRIVLLIGNIFFIAVSSGKRTVFLITLLVAVSYYLGILIENQVVHDRKRQAKALFIVNVLFSIGVLCYFKFFKYTWVVFKNFLLLKGVDIPSIYMPIGVSYYTLTMIAYAYDVYHKKHEAERSFIDYFVFITYFPSIVQGPINLYRKVMPHFKAEHHLNAERVIKGAQRMLWGYFKKVVIADRIGVFVAGVLGSDSTYGILVAWSMVLYSFQIYADFSGGIDVIMGISEILDIHLIENFRAPLMARSVTEYWQRWHMSLGEFMEKYIYYPIVLDKRIIKLTKRINNKYLRKVFAATFASVVVFVVVGIWHGTGWNYVVYGCYQAFFVSTAILFAPIYKKLKVFLKINENCITWKVFQIIRTFIILTIGRYFIRAASLKQAFLLMFRTAKGFKWSGMYVLFDGTMNNYGLDYKNVYLMYICILLLIIIDVVHDKKIEIRNLLMRQDIVFRYLVYIMAIFGIIIMGIYGPGFDSASFIYQGF